MSNILKPFIPSWLDDAGLSQAEFRLYCHLCRRADNKTGIAWPSYESIQKACGMSHKTVWKIIKMLEGRSLIAKTGKPFGGSCRYKILSSIIPEGKLLDAANHSPEETIEPPQSFPSGNTNHSPEETPIVSLGEREGSPLKEIQGRVSNKSGDSLQRNNSLEEIEFANWFKSSLPKEQQDRLSKDWLNGWCKVYDELVRIDKRTPEKIREVCQWARTDSFWKPNFNSPLKLRKRNGDGTLYFDVFTGKMKSSPTNHRPASASVNMGGRTTTYED